MIKYYNNDIFILKCIYKLNYYNNELNFFTNLLKFLSLISNNKLKYLSLI